MPIPQPRRRTTNIALSGMIKKPLEGSWLQTMEQSGISSLKPLELWKVSLDSENSLESIFSD